MRYPYRNDIVCNRHPYIAYLNHGMKIIKITVTNLLHEVLINVTEGAYIPRRTYPQMWGS